MAERLGRPHLSCRRLFGALTNLVWHAHTRLAGRKPQPGQRFRVYANHFTAEVVPRAVSGSLASKVKR
jgi:hypothetical protein